MSKTIIILVPNLQSGGSERIAARLSKVLESRFNVITALFDTTDISYEYGGRLVDMNLPSQKGKIGKIINIVRRIKKLKKLIKTENADTVISFTSAADYTNAFSRAKCTRIVSCRGRVFLENNLSRYKKMCRLSSGILFNSKGMRDIYLKAYPEDEQKAFVLYNLFDTDNIREKAKEPLGEEYGEFYSKHKVVTTVSSFVYEKGHIHLLRSFEILKESVPDAGLVIVGHRGGYEEKIRQIAAGSEYSADIKFVGFSDNPFKYVANSDVFALSSLSEGFPNVLAEAMSVGTVAVAADCSTGPREILYAGYDKNKVISNFEVADYGIITPPFDDDGNFDLSEKNEKHKIFAKAIETAITEKELSQTLGEKARKRAAEFDEKAIVNTYVELLTQL